MSLTNNTPYGKKYAMSIRVYNTYTGKKEDFIPVEEGKLKLYVCGVTVYDHCHIGHGRSAVVFDVIYRYFLARGYDVTFVKNFTDIDDKILKKSWMEGIPWREVADKYIESYYEDMERLNILRPTYEPKATEHIEEMIELVDTLLKKGYAYAVDGDVYFSVDSFKGYGELSKRSLDEMMAGARIEVDERKKNPLDFALWKSSKENEPSWDAPFGRGRPGWHIECSVMSTKYLGNPFDIHGGGKDLIFPHHENEKAQSEAATGKRFVNYWIHNGFVNMDKEKMSKSLGNYLLLKDFMKSFSPETLRLFFLSTHYRSPVDYNDRAIEDTNQALHRLYYTVKRVAEINKAYGVETREFPETKDIVEGFYRAMDDDFNTALALSYVFELTKVINRLIDENDESTLPYVLYTKDALLSVCNILGLAGYEIHDFEAQEKLRHLRRVGLDINTVEGLIDERNTARKSRDFRRADEIREYLLKFGIILQDTPSKTEWRVKHKIH
ncbi:MAG: cysteine--tRNA ligase [Syntrophorhabdaceae bacterium]|nr:cysteine--tRNA ligase [Syntrophorhabdaceae bacterium]